MKHVTQSFGKTFGPVGSFSGIVLFTVGLIYLIIGYLGGIALMLIGGFIGFTRPYTSVDYENRRVRYGDKLFGIIKTGKWQAIQADMQLGCWHSNKVYRTYSRSNRALDITQKQDLVCLFDKHGNKLMAIKRLDEKDNEEAELEVLAKQLGLSIR